MTLGNQSSSKLQMGSSRNRDPLQFSRDEDPSWDLEDPHKPRRKPSRTYSVLFIIKTFINHHLAVKRILDQRQGSGKGWVTRVDRDWSSENVLRRRRGRGREWREKQGAGTPL